MNINRLIYLGVWISLFRLFSIGLCETEITIYPAEQIKQRVAEYIKNNLFGHDIKYDIQWIKKMSDVSLLNKPDSIHITHNGEALQKGNNIFKVAFYSNKQPIKTVHISVRINIIKKVYILTKTVRKDKSLHPEDIIIEEREITSLVGNPIDTNDNIFELFAAKTLSGGRILMERDLRENYCINKGDILNIEIRKKTFFIKLQVLALQNGSKGDIVWVKNLQNKMRMRVRITGPQIATIL